ncbi:MAG: hypothetical protein U9Q99_00965 [Nanoarchaeota archaeon]|nr:hypothetical protein [Nanoarchaeota archaeon]
MRPINLSCPQEMVEVDGLWQYKPVLPGFERNPMNTVEIQVDVLGIDGEKALIFLPKILRQSNENTATISIFHLN